MAGSVNKVILVANCGRDPEIRFTQSGKKIANFSVATSEQWRDKQSGERKERSEWHRVVVFNEGLADIVERFVKKGSKVYIEGQLRTRKWQGQDGKDMFSTEVVLDGFNANLTLLDSKNASSGAPSGNSGASGGSSGGYGAQGGYGSQHQGGPDLDEEIPF